MSKLAAWPNLQMGENELSATDKIKDAAKEVSKRVGQAASTAKTKAEEAAHEVHEQAGAAASKAKDAVKKGAGDRRCQRDQQEVVGLSKRICSPSCCFAGSGWRSWLVLPPGAGQFVVG